VERAGPTEDSSGREEEKEGESMSMQCLLADGRVGGGGEEGGTCAISTATAQSKREVRVHMQRANQVPSSRERWKKEESRNKETRALDRGKCKRENRMRFFFFMICACS
jgi:hypothetical protein